LTYEDAATGLVIFCWFQRRSKKLWYQVSSSFRIKSKILVYTALKHRSNFSRPNKL